MVCKGGRKKPLLFLLYAVTAQYVLPPVSFTTTSFEPDLITERGWISKREEKNEWYVGSNFYFILFYVGISHFLNSPQSSNSGYDKGEAASCLFDLTFVFSLPISEIFPSVLLEIPLPSVMGVTI